MLPNMDFSPLQKAATSVLTLLALQEAVRRLEWGKADERTNWRRQEEPCGRECHYHPTYGWVPEAGCPMHDPEP